MDKQVARARQPGVYPYRLACGLGGFKRWDGKQWFSWCFTVKAAAAARYVSFVQSDARVTGDAL